MPLTSFQTAVLKLLATNRSAESFVAGGVALIAREPVRWSADVDVFHDAEDAVMRASDADMATLREAGYSTQQAVWTPTFRRAWIARGDEGVKLEWCQDSAWRFFPIEQDELLRRGLGGLRQGSWIRATPFAERDASQLPGGSRRAP